MDREGLELICGGHLLQWKWSPALQSYTADDITDRSYSFLFNYCILADGITLKDFFLLINASQKIYSAMCGPSFDELLEERL